jgi:Bacterial Ig-like domain (group 2)
MQDSRTLGQSNSRLKRGFDRVATALAIAAALGVWGCGGRPTSASVPPSSPPPTPISVTVTPNSVTVLRDSTQAFTAKVTGTSNTAVTWSLEESSGGTIDSAGLYTPPQSGAGTFYVIATSQANSAAFGVAAVTVPMPQITISPAAATLRPDGTRLFGATVSGLTNTAVNFTIQESAGGADQQRRTLYSAGCRRFLSCRRHQRRRNGGQRERYRYRDDLFQCIYVHHRESQRCARHAHRHLATE